MTDFTSSTAPADVVRRQYLASAAGDLDKATGRPIDVRVAHHFVVRAGQIVRFEQFVDTAKVRDAMPTVRPAALRG
jgi:ketosteroid isomerase-like protein